MDEFLTQMYNTIIGLIDKSDTSKAFLNNLKTNLEQKNYRWAFLDIAEYRKTNKLDIDEKILEDFWWKYAN